MGEPPPGQVNPGALVAGVEKATIPLFGATLLTTPLVAFPAAIPPTGSSFSMTVPDLSVICGFAPMVVLWQGIQLDPGAQNQWSFTNGLLMKLGR